MDEKTGNHANAKTRRFERTDDAIIAAFEKILTEQSVGDLTVANISRIAGIYRKTFYLHYSSIEELHNEVLRRSIEQYEATFSKLKVPFDYHVLTRNMFEFYTSTTFREKIATQTELSALRTQLSRSAVKRRRSIYNLFQNFSPDEQELLNSFMVQSSIAAFRQWVSSGKKVPMDRAIQLIGDLLKTGVRSLVEGSSSQRTQ